MVRRMDDDIDLFCRHIGEVLRNLPPYEKSKAKKHLGEVLSDYEIMAASHSSGRSTSLSLSNSTPDERSTTSSGLYTPSPPHSPHFVRSYSPVGTTTVSPKLTGQGNAPGNFQLDAYSPISSAAASPGPSGTTSGLGYVPGPIHTSYSYANSPMSTELESPAPTDLSLRVNQSDREEENDFVDTVLNFP